jgi:VanZ family protein
MVLIFAGSSDTASGEHSSRLIGPILRWLVPGLSPEAQDWVITLIRKAAHMTEYAILALLVWRALACAGTAALVQSPRRRAAAAFAVACLYAATDEFHQLFVANREGSLRDVLIDTAGAGLGLALLWAWGRWRSRAAQPPRAPSEIRT